MHGQGLAASQQIRISHIARYGCSGRKNQNSRFPQGPPGSEGDAGNDTWQCARQNNLPDGLELRGPKSQTRLPIEIRHRADGLLCHPYQQRQIQQHQGKGSTDDTEAHSHDIHKHNHAKKPQHDGWYGRQALGAQANGPRQPGIPCVFSKINTGTHGNRDGYGHR